VRVRSPLRTASGYTLVELVLVIVLIVTVSTYVVSDFTNQSDSVRWEQTRAKLQSIRSAILGDDTTNAEGQRAHFGYFGDMGRIPATLTDLTTLGTQVEYTYNQTLGFGAGWRGPYISEGVSGSRAVDKDEWGVAFTYNTSEPTPSIKSLGADRAVSGSLYGKDLTMELPQAIRLATVKGWVLDKDTKLSGKSVQLDFATNGSIGTSTTTTTADGEFVFANVPYGIRTLRVTSPPPLGPKQIIVDKADYVVSAGILNYAGSTEAVTYVASTASLRGGSGRGLSNMSILATLKSTYRTDQRIASITVTNPLGAKLLAIHVNGLKETFPTPVANGAAQALSGGLTIAANSLVNPIQLDFDRSVRNELITVTFTWSNTSQVDTVSFSAAPNWGVAGTLDTAFGTAGKLLTAFSTVASLRGLTLDTAGRFIATGLLSGANTRIVIARYYPNGDLDTTFSTVGSFSATDTLISYRSVVQKDGKIVSFSDTTTDIRILRLNTSGSWDTTFGTIGAKVTGISGTDDIHRGIVDTDDRILGVGASNNVLLIARWKSNGNLDTSFSTVGYNRLSGISGTNKWYGIVAQSDGTYVVAGDSDGANNLLVARYKPDGALDTSYATVGYLKTVVGAASTGFRAQPFIQTDGKIVQGGEQNGDPAVARYNTNGSLDTSFFTTGRIFATLLNINVSASSIAGDLAGRIVVGGWGVGNNFSFVRLNTNGNLDTSFAATGGANVDVSGNDELWSIVLTTTGKICGGGFSVTPRFSIMCLWP
jgi:uncharacterized delta-60 repeat protein